MNRLPEPCPPRDALRTYARGGRNPRLAGHIAYCDRCAWIVSEEMEADPALRNAEVIDITPERTWWRTWWQRAKAFVRGLMAR
ncbi:MAG TPA: hypothetical protein VFC21_02870 [Bryobacteraceae bacterium]|nr:hypothetical protein [Bryobacteraceae bacterium]